MDSRPVRSACIGSTVVDSTAVTRIERQLGLRPRKLPLQSPRPPLMATSHPSPHTACTRTTPWWSRRSTAPSPRGIGRRTLCRIHTVFSPHWSPDQMSAAQTAEPRHRDDTGSSQPVGVGLFSHLVPMSADRRRWSWENPTNRWYRTLRRRVASQGGLHSSSADRTRCICTPYDLNSGGTRRMPARVPIARRSLRPRRRQLETTRRSLLSPPTLRPVALEVER